jgi:GNAT superfamily N-acetyltransferase
MDLGKTAEGCLQLRSGSSCEFDQAIDGIGGDLKSRQFDKLFPIDLAVHHPSRTVSLLTRWRTALSALDAASLEVQRRPLTLLEAQVIVSQIANSQDITGYSIAEWTGGKDTFVLIDTATNSLLGGILVHHLALNWSEVAVVFVLEEYQGQGLGNYMLSHVLRTLEHSRRSILLFFRKENMRQLVSARGFDIYDDQDEFCKKSTFNRFYLRILYQIQWLANAYRRKELKRKKQKFETEFTFHLAVRMAKPFVFVDGCFQRTDLA